MPTATVTSKGQIVIPKAIRDRLELHPGDQVDFIVQHDGAVLLRPAVEDVRALEGLLHRAGRKPVTIEEMSHAVRNRARHSR
jgi:antitoxin PrlF